MKSPAKGALVMVIAGALTFSAANGILKATELITTENSSVLTGIQKKSEGYRQLDKKAESKTVTVKNKAKQKTEEITPSSATSPKKGESNKAVAAVQTDTELSTRKPAANPVIKTESVSAKKPSAPEPASASSGNKTTSESAKPVTSPKDSQAPASGTGGNSTASPAEKVLNHGQQVSQSAKEKAESRRADKGKEIKENNGKNL
ncbi:prolipoprotein diacylglyceryl transferase [Cytobacillus firmus]